MINVNDIDNKYLDDNIKDIIVSCEDFFNNINEKYYFIDTLKYLQKGLKENFEENFIKFVNIILTFQSNKEISEIELEKYESSLFMLNQIRILENSDIDLEKVIVNKFLTLKNKKGIHILRCKDKSKKTLIEVINEIYNFKNEIKDLIQEANDNLYFKSKLDNKYNNKKQRNINAKIIFKKIITDINKKKFINLNKLNKNEKINIFFKLINNLNIDFENINFDTVVINYDNKILKTTKDYFSFEDNNSISKLIKNTLYKNINNYIENNIKKIQDYINSD